MEWLEERKENKCNKSIEESMVHALSFSFFGSDQGGEDEVV